MKIKTIGSFAKLSSRELAEHTVISVDLLRSGTSIIWALHNGAGKVIPTSDPGEAALIASRLGDCVLSGERGGIIIPGFTLGNSPEEFSADVVSGKNIVISTTNGTGAICAMESASALLVGAMINCDAVAKAALSIGKPVIIMCSGTEGEISADDLYAAGAIARSIAQYSDTPVEACDLTRVSVLVYESWRGGGLEETLHYSRLEHLGFGADVKFCLKENITSVVPIYRNGVLERF